MWEQKNHMTRKDLLYFDSHWSDAPCEDHKRARIVRQVLADYITLILLFKICNATMSLTILPSLHVACPDNTM
jgi:hypothetical protein